MLRRNAFILAAMIAASCAIPSQAILFSGAPSGGGGGSQLATITVYNPSGGSVSSVPQQYTQAFQTGDVSSGQKIEVRKSDGTTVVTTQEFNCSTWAQDGSRKACGVAFIEPDTITAGSSTTYKIFSVSGSPNNSGSVTTANITGNTNFCIKSSDLTQANGTAETGTYDFICLNNVITNLSQYNGSTGYGSNPKGGWEWYAQGPNVSSIHAFQYAQKESDSSYHKWLRTDMWIEFRGSGSTPCPCKISALVSPPNIYGPLSGATNGATTEGGYVYSLTLSNGANTLYNWGGASDPRTITNLTSSNFDTSNDVVNFAGGNLWEKTGGAFPVRVTSTGTCPTGITCGSLYWIHMQGARDQFANKDQTPFYIAECRVAGSSGCVSGQSAPVDLTSAGSGTISVTPYVGTTHFTGVALLDSKSMPIWTDSSGVAASAPVTLLAQDFSYLTQKTKATPPFITALAGTLTAVSSNATWTYYPGSYFLPWNIDQTGDGVGDERIGYFPHSSAIALFQPSDANAAQNSRAFAAAFARQHMYYLDETVGLPVVWNNGHAKNGVTYATLGTVQPTNRTWPFSGSNSPSWISPSTADVDLEPLVESYGRMEGSHMPAPQMEAILRTADPMWQHTLVMQANNAVGNYYIPSATISSTTYYRVHSANNDNQVRSIAWTGRAFDQADYFQPAGSPISQYLHDIEQDNADWLYLYHTTANSSFARALGFLFNDTLLDASQLWQDDFVWLQVGVQAWRNEYANYRNFTNNYFYKYVISRMDSSAGGCFYYAPARIVAPYLSFAAVSANLPQTWADAWVNNVYNVQAAGSYQGSIGGGVLTISSVNSTGYVYQVRGGGPQILAGDNVYSGAGHTGQGTIASLGTGTGGVGTYNLSGSSNVGATNIDVATANNGYTLPPYYSSCPSSTTMMGDPGGTDASTPNGLTTFAVGSAGMGAVLGIPNASSLYATGRTWQYAHSPYPLSFSAFTTNGSTFVAAPEFAYGPLGAAQ